MPGPQTWTTPRPDPPIGIEDDDSSLIASLIKAVIIGGLVIAIFYYYRSEQQDQQQSSPEDLQEARRKRLEKLEEIPKQQPQPVKSSSPSVPISSAEDDDMQILRLKRPPPEQQQEGSSSATAKAQAPAGPAAKKYNVNPSPPLTVQPKEKPKEEKPKAAPNPTAPKPAPKPAPPKQESTPEPAPAKKRKSISNATKRTPREALLQALSSITGMAVTTPSSPPQTGKAKTATKVQLNDSLLPASVTWKEILLQSSTNSLFEPFQSHLLDAKKPTSYGPTKLTDRRLYKASDWYHKSKTWARDSHSASAAALEELQSILEAFQKWIVETAVQQLKVDVGKLDSTTTLEEEDDDDDVDLGLFADESYGGGTSTAGASTITKADDKTDTLLGELLFLLSDPSGPKVLTKPFLAHIIQSYDSTVNNNTKSLATVLLQECLSRLPAPDQKGKLEWDKTQRSITGVTNLLTLSPDVVKALATTIPNERLEEGKAWEDKCSLRSLLCLAAWTVPRFNKNATSRPPNQAPNPNDLLPQAYHNSMVQAMGPEYPVALYAPQGYTDALKSFHGTNKHAQTIQRAARAAGALALKKLAASAMADGVERRKGGLLFDWVGGILETNEPLVDMLQSDLLSPDSAQALCATRPFLLGIVSSLLQMCSTTLSIKLADQGWEAFDYRYLTKEGADTPTKKQTGIVIPSQERCLINMPAANSNSDATSLVKDRPPRFAGATEFFFLTAALLRVSLFPGFRVQEEFQSMLRGLFAQIPPLAAQQPSADQLRRMRGIDQLQKATSVAQGWNAFVDDPEISPLITTFSILQLQWVSMAVEKSAEAMEWIPEWFVKLPSQWLAHVAQFTPHLLAPNQGEAAVQYATRILQAGTTTTSSQVSKRTFSPPVLCQLIRIAGAFVREGVRRARNREKSKSHHRGRRGFKQTQQPKPDEKEDDFEMDIIDDRELDIYHSFDKGDLGVTVFTNEFVAKYLCPTLMRAYMAMDAVEGMDVEREHHFEKFEVKHEVADLLLRLWCHPNGQSLNAIVSDLDEVAMNEFCSSIAGALGFQLDQSCQFILDIRDIKAAHESSLEVVTARRRGRQPPPLSRRDAAAIEHHAKFISFSLHQCRRLLMILCYFSKEDKIASVLGGNSSPGKKLVGKSAAADLAAMFLNLMERLTDEDGAIHAELEMRQLRPAERSSDMLEHLGSVAPDKLKAELKYLLHSRRFALLEYGLDVSFLAHQFLVLAARWHLAVVSVDKEGQRTSKFLEAVVRSDICDPKRLLNVFRRLVGSPKEMSGTEADNAAYILERDGHVDLTIWKDSYKFEGSGPDKGKGRKRTAKQDRMSHSDLENMVDLSDIETFLTDLEEAEAGKNTFAVAARWGTREMQKLEDALLTAGDALKDEDYTDCLEDWVVSSDSFLSAAGNGSFAHSYDSIVRGRGVEGMGAGKILAKEARKCMKLLPAPHPNTSVFVCFAEERTDLCKAIIVGAADTPFSMGMFEFDILFPTNYPQSPPLFNFKTTGDGRTRISSNLYNDGKVCISILGTYQAFDDSQRWNPSTSSLAQVLASLQTQLLGDEEPYFSDGFNHDSVRGTPAGERGSKRFNNKIRLHTLRYAIIDPLKHPPLGFNDVTKQHFALCRKRVLAQARLWTVEAQGTELHKSFVRAYEELVTLLSRDDLVRHKAPGETEDKVWGAVPLDAADYKGLEQNDQAFVQYHQQSLRACFDSSASPSIGVASAHAGEQTNQAAPLWEQAGPIHQMPVGYNPWAAGANAEAPVGPSHNESVANGDDEDFDDMYG